jgi:hypothetical protein
MIVCRPHIYYVHIVLERNEHTKIFERCLGKLPTEDRDGSDKILLFDKTMGVGLNWLKI